METIAFYLPQYHVIPENEKIYGKGFTEWDNVRSAKPQFPGHKQPRAPHPSIGYYNLLDENFLEYQHRLAWENGVKNFCYYYYNMNGKNLLLEKPIQLAHKNTNIHNGFCLCWAHPSWYNNKLPDKPIYIEQVYSPENAKLVFKDMAQYFDNDRYIKIFGRPFLSVFAPERNPLMKVYAEIWREEARKRGWPGIWLAGVEAYAGIDPNVFGFDSMIEFAPSWTKEAQLSPENEPFRRLDYAQTLRFMLAKEVPDYYRNRCAFPAWDDTARRGDRALAAVNTSPVLYKTYLECLVQYTKSFLPKELQYIFINAWNEWGEGCYLEPDKEYGYTYLNITRKVMEEALLEEQKSA